MQTEGEMLREVRVEIVNAGQSKRVPLALWDVFGGCVGPFEVLEANDGWTARVVPHPGASAAPDRGGFFGFR